MIHPLTEAKKVSKYKSGHLCSKMWILPSGVVQSLDCWHFHWLKNNTAIAKKFGLTDKQLELDEQPLRLAALARGFVRVNYEHRDGHMTIELLDKYLKKPIKDAIFMLIADNIDDVYKLTINVMSGKSVDSRSVNLFSYDDRDKLNHIPFISESASAMIRVIARLLR